MRRFDIIGVDLQLRLGTHLCGLGEQQVAVRLMRFGLLGIRRDLQIADKTAAGVVLQYKLDELVGCTAAYAMRHMGLGGHVILRRASSPARKSPSCSLLLIGSP